MISTFYSNSFEVLRTVLTTKIKFNLEDLRLKKASLFDRIKVIVPSTMTADYLNRYFADTFGVNPGVEFSNVASWIFSVLGRSLSNQESSELMDWTLYKILLEKKNSSTIPAGEERLYSYLKNLDNVGVLEFARHLNTVFVTYGSYRFDWLQEWTTEKFKLPCPPLPAVRYKFEKPELEKNPDFTWQKHLWQELIRTTNEASETGNGQIMGWLENTIERTRNNTPADDQMPTHLFLPFSIPPNLLPLIRAYEHSGAELNLYILNPSSEYWFESVPKGQFDWKDLSSESEAPLKYLQTNDASTRAAIDRLDGFLFSEEESSILETEPTEEEKTKRRNSLVAHPGRRNIVRTPEEVKPEVKAEIDSAYLEYPSDSMLHKFQNSLLRLDSSLLPSEPDGKDVSLRILKAPSFQREVEATLDILQNWFTDPNRSLNPSEVLIVVPDIEKAAPVIDGVLSSLPSDSNLNLSIPWKILGLSEESQNRMADAFVSLGKLLISDCSPSQFFAWLEKPVVQEQWGFSLDDLSIIKRWLTTAGFGGGFDAAQLKESGFSGEDISLQHAMERLTLGFLLDPVSPLPFKDSIPIRGDEEAGFDEVSEEGGRILLSLSSLYSALTEARNQLKETHFELAPEQWLDRLLVLKETFFGNVRNPNESFRLEEIIKGTAQGLEAAIGRESKSVSFDVLLSELNSDLSKTKLETPCSGTLTFAPISMARGIPFKVICCLGFDQAGGFPGTPKFEEFDLTKTVRRRGDRDARKDNNAVFLDTLLSARENLLISYTVGTKPQSENNSSIVIENFKSYFLTNAREEGASDGTGWEKAEKLWKSIVSIIPLNRFSERNFSDGKENNLFWRSPRDDVLRSLQSSEKNKTTLLSRFADIGIPEKKLPKGLQNDGNRTLTANFLIEFLTSYEEWSAKLLKLTTRDETVESRSIVPDTENRLFASSVKRGALALSEEGLSLQEIIKLAERNPKYGFNSLRSALFRPLADDVTSQFLEIKAFISNHSLARTEKEFDYVVPESWGSDINRLTDELSDLYRQKGENTSLLRFEIFTSSNSIKKSFLRQLIWAVAEHPYDVISFSEGKKKVLTGKTLGSFASRLLPCFLKLFESQLKYGLGLGADPDALMWQGISEEKINLAATASSKIAGALKSLPAVLTGENGNLSAKEIKKAEGYVNTIIDESGKLFQILNSLSSRL